MKNSALGKRTNLLRDNDEREVIDVNDSPSQGKNIMSYYLDMINSPIFSEKKRPKRLGKRLEQS